MPRLPVRPVEDFNSGDDIADHQDACGVIVPRGVLPQTDEFASVRFESDAFDLGPAPVDANQHSTALDRHDQLHLTMCVQASLRVRMGLGVDSATPRVN